MRISDWSSDVCSSDLPCSGDEFDNHVPVVEAERLASSLALHRVEDRRTGRYAHEFLAVTDERGGGNNDHQVAATDSHDRPLDRKSVVEGKGVTVRVDLGGRRYLNKTTDQNTKKKQ